MIGALQRAAKPVRNKSLSFTAAATMVLALSTTAYAADLRLPVKAPPPLPVFSWTGFYFGADVGYGWGRDTTTELFTATGLPTGFVYDYSPRGVLGGIYAGANYQTGPLVFGIEGDIEGADIKAGFTDVPLGGAGDTRIHWQGSVRGRLGFAVDRVLFYGTGGAAFADISHTYRNLFAGTAETTSAVRTGWTAGAGVEFAVMPQLLLRAEYRFADYGKYRYDSVVTFPGLTGEQEPTVNAVRVGAAYKF